MQSVAHLSLPFPAAVPLPQSRDWGSVLRLTQNAFLARLGVETTGNREQFTMNSAQREMPMIGHVGELKTFSPAELGQAETYHDALLLQVQYSRVKRSRRSLAALLSVSTSKLSKILNSEGAETPAHLPGETRELLIAATQNLFLVQWELRRLGAAVHVLSPEQQTIARLETENAALRARAA